MKNIKAILLGITIISASIYSAEVSDKEVLNKQLIEAAKHGDLDALKKAIDNGVDIRFKDPKDNDMAIHWAAFNGHVEIIKYLSKLIDINIKGNLDWTPLHNSTDRGHITAIIELVKLGANIEVKNIDQSTPLHLAAGKGRVQSIIELVKLGANIEAININQDTPLHYAAYNGHIQAIIELVKLGANIEVKNIDQNTPLHRAARSGQVLPIIELIKLGANIEAKNINNAYALHQAIHNNKLEAISLLLTLNSPIDWLDRIEKLLEINNKFGAMICSVLKNDTEYIKKLLSQKVEYDLLNFQDAVGTTAVMYSIGRKQEEIINAFIKYDDQFGGLDLFHINQNGQSVLSLALDNNNDYIIGRLFRYVKTADTLEKVLIKTSQFSMPLINIISNYLFTGYSATNKNKFLSYLGL